jgi:hypothetical protein
VSQPSLLPRAAPQFCDYFWREIDVWDHDLDQVVRPVLAGVESFSAPGLNQREAIPGAGLIARLRGAEISQLTQGNRMRQETDQIKAPSIESELHWRRSRSEQPAAPILERHDWGGTVTVGLRVNSREPLKGNAAKQ